MVYIKPVEDARSDYKYKVIIEAIAKTRYFHTLSAAIIEAKQHAPETEIIIQRRKNHTQT